MHRTKRLVLALCATGVAGLTAASSVLALPLPRAGTLTPVPSANPKSPGFSAPNVLSPELQEAIQAQGAMKLENPDPAVGYYGYDSNGPLLPLPAQPGKEATKTEPDKNTYLVFHKGLKGADSGYDYGTHFLFQGHEAGSPGIITRVN